MTVPVIIGVDSGAKGAIAFLTPSGDLLAIEDMPVDTVQKGKHSRSRLSRHRLMALLNGAAGAAAFIEELTYRPMKRPDPKTGQLKTVQMGAMGAGAMGETYGGIAMALVASGAVLTEVSTGAWKATAGVRGGKDESRRRAAELFPAQAHLFARDKDNGRADAALVGWHGVQEMKGGVK